MESSIAVNALSALAQDTRLEIYRLLVQAGPDGLAVGEIGQAVRVPPATLNHHLAILKQAGMVNCHREGRRLIHSADFACMDDLLTYLTENCCRDAACTPKMC